MLTDPDCKNAKCPPGLKRRRLTDGGGLYLEVSPAGSKRWFWKFYPDGKESRLALGSYPEVTLKAARLERDKARETRRTGTNPVQHRRAERASKASASATTFEGVAREFHAMKLPEWSERHAARWLGDMRKDVFPWIGSLPIAGVKPAAVLQTLRRVEARGANETAHNLRQSIGQVFRYGVQTDRCERNPVTDMRGALKAVQTKHFAAILDPVKVGELLRAIDGYSGQPTTRAALALSALFFQRPGNVRAMEWSEIDTDAALWTVPAAKMKGTKERKLNGRPHLVPLAPQALAILAELRPLTGHGKYVFPSLLTRERCMSDGTINTALRRMGYSGDDMTAHGFRAMGRTVIAERLPGIAPDVIEAQLAHGKSGPLGMAYDRAEFMEQRRQMMATWADYLDRVRRSADVVPLAPRAA